MICCSYFPYYNWGLYDLKYLYNFYLKHKLLELEKVPKHLLLFLNFANEQTEERGGKPEEQKGKLL